MSNKVKQPPKKPCPKCGHLYRVTYTCKNCGADLSGTKWHDGWKGIMARVVVAIVLYALFIFFFPFHILD